MIIWSLRNITSFSQTMKCIMNMWLHMGHLPFKLSIQYCSPLLVVTRWFLSIQNASLVVQNVIKKTDNFIAVILVVSNFFIHWILDKQIWASMESKGGGNSTLPRDPPRGRSSSPSSISKSHRILSPPPCWPPPWRGQPCYHNVSGSLINLHRPVKNHLFNCE